MGTQTDGLVSLKCLPRTQGEGCTDQNWAQMQDTFQGEGCDVITDTPIVKWEGTPECLSDYQPPVKTRRQTCIPRIRYYWITYRSVHVSLPNLFYPYPTQDIT